MLNEKKVKNIVRLFNCKKSQQITKVINNKILFMSQLLKFARILAELGFN